MVSTSGQTSCSIIVQIHVSMNTTENVHRCLMGTVNKTEVYTQKYITSEVGESTDNKKSRPSHTQKSQSS
uniref:Uncharacterized protein n=1 Tax=Arion vulgaris TaxID=1028688 RepID=A0A0B7A5T4_9EUPU